MRTSKLHDNLVLQVSYLLFICSVGGHQWLTMSPESFERNKKGFVLQVPYLQLCLCSPNHWWFVTSLGPHGVAVATFKDNLIALHLLTLVL